MDRKNWKGGGVQTTNYISVLVNILARTLHFSSSFRIWVYWFMYSIITNEMRLYDGNWWQPVVIRRWLMMWASAGGTEVNNSFTWRGTIVMAPSPAPTRKSVSLCACVRVGVCSVEWDCTRTILRDGNGGHTNWGCAANGLIVTYVLRNAL